MRSICVAPPAVPSGGRQGKLRGFSRPGARQQGVCLHSGVTPMSAVASAVPESSGAIAPISEIIAELRAGRMVILVDEEDRENEGDLVMAAEYITPEAINFMVTHARGLVCLTLTEERCQRLGL